MKSKLAFITAIVIAASMAMTGCGSANENTASTDSLAETTASAENSTTGSSDAASKDTASETTSEQTSSTSDSGASLSVTKSEITKATDAYKVAEVGNWETYLDGFEIPANFAFVTDSDEASINMMRYDKKFGINMTFLAPAEMVEDEITEETASETTESAPEVKKTETSDNASKAKVHVTFDFYTVEEDGVTTLYVAYDADGKAGGSIKSIVDESDSANEAKTMFNDIDAVSEASFEFKEYGGETTVDGTTFDVIKATMIDNHDYGDVDELVGESTLPVDIYFTKDGVFDSINFDAEGDKGTIFAIDDFDIPDKDWKEAPIEEAASTMFGGFMMMAMSTGTFDELNTAGEIDGEIIEGDLHEDEDREHDHSEETAAATETTED